MTDWLAFAAALVASTSFTPAARNLAFSIGLIDQPGPRKVHAAPMPLLGGLAVYIAMIFAIAVFVGDEAWSQMLGIFVAATVALVIGTLDDHGFLHHQVKLMLAMPFAAIILLVTGMHSEIFHPIASLPVIGLPGAWLDYVLSFVWIVGITAAFSILDHMDGLCAGVAAVACAFFFYFASHEGQVLVSALAAATAGEHRYTAAVGLPIRPLKFRLVVESATSPSPRAPWCTPRHGPHPEFITRLRRGLVPFSTPGKDHVAHRLVSHGFSHRTAVVTMYGVGIGGGLLAVWVSRASVAAGLWTGGLVAVAALAVIALLERAPYERQQKT